MRAIFLLFIGTGLLGAIQAQESWDRARVWLDKGDTLTGIIRLDTWKELADGPFFLKDGSATAFRLQINSTVKFEVGELRYERKLVDLGPGIGMQFRFVRVWVAGAYQLDQVLSKKVNRLFLEIPEGRRYELIHPLDSDKLFSLPPEATVYFAEKHPVWTAAMPVNWKSAGEAANWAALQPEGAQFRDHFRERPLFEHRFWAYGSIVRLNRSFLRDRTLALRGGISWEGYFNRLNRRYFIGSGVEYHRGRMRDQSFVYQDRMGPLGFLLAGYRVAGSPNMAAGVTIGASGWVVYEQIRTLPSGVGSGSWRGVQPAPNFSFYFHYRGGKGPGARLEMGYRQFFFLSAGIGSFKSIHSKLSN